MLLAGEDLWHAFNLIREGDLVTATTFRKVTVGSQNAETERVKIKLTIKVEAVDFDPEGEEQWRCAHHRPHNTKALARKLDWDACWYETDTVVKGAMTSSTCAQ